MKKALIPVVLLIVSLLAGGVYFLTKNRGSLPLTSMASVTNPGSTWKFEPAIAQPIAVNGGKDTDATLGDLAVNNVAVAIPKGSFDAETGIMLFTPKSVPGYAANEIDTLGAPIEITAAGSSARLNEKALITFKFDTSKLTAGADASRLRVAYYDGKKWEYVKPQSVDMAAGTITFGTYHFSTYGPASINNDAVITAKWIHSTAVGNKLTGQLNGASDQVAEKIMAMTMDKMGITDTASRAKVRTELMKDASYQEINKFYGTGDPYEAHKKIALIVATKIAENVPKLVFEDAKKRYAAGELPGDVQAVAQAAGYAAEGQYKEAAKIIGEQIADKFLITTAGKIAVIVTQYEIDSWKNAEVEAAYMAYKQGSNQYFYGYNVDKGDFDSVWDQMRGVRRQLEIDAVAKEDAARSEAGLPPLTDGQKDALKESLKNSFRQQFTMRAEKEAEFAAEEERLKKIVDAFQKADFFSAGGGPTGLDKGFDYETKLDVLHHFAQKMMQDTKRVDITDKTGLLVEGKLSLEDLVQGARYYFGGDKGKDDYAKFLSDRFGIAMYPELADLAGNWKGTSVITDIQIPDEIPADVKEELKKEGCEELDFDKINLDDVKKNANQAIGKEQPAEFTLTPTSETGGTLISTANSKTQTIPFTYANGVISASTTQQGAVITLTLTPTVSGTSYAIGGSMNMNLKNLFKITGTVSLSKQ